MTDHYMTAAMRSELHALYEPLRHECGLNEAKRKAVAEMINRRRVRLTEILENYEVRRIVHGERTGPPVDLVLLSAELALLAVMR